MTVLQKTYGQCLDPHIPRAIHAKARFHYVLHHCLPNSAKIHNQRTEQVLHAMYTGIGQHNKLHQQQSNEEEEQPPAISSPLMFTPEAISNPLQPLDATAAPLSPSEAAIVVVGVRLELLRPRIPTIGISWRTRVVQGGRSECRRNERAHEGEGGSCPYTRTISHW